jgi:hypothetical protein
MTRKAEIDESALGIKESAVQYAMARALEQDSKVDHENDDSRLRLAIDQFLDNYEAYLRRS